MYWAGHQPTTARALSTVCSQLATLVTLSAIVRSSPCLCLCASHSAIMMVNVVENLGPVRAGALVGVVLAGGEGRRMGPGVPKPLRLLGGRPMVAHVVERLRPQAMDLVVVANDPLP